MPLIIFASTFNVLMQSYLCFYKFQASNLSSSSSSSSEHSKDETSTQKASKKGEILFFGLITLRPPSLIGGERVSQSILHENLYPIFTLLDVILDVGIVNRLGVWAPTIRDIPYIG